MGLYLNPLPVFHVRIHFAYFSQEDYSFHMTWKEQKKKKSYHLWSYYIQMQMSHFIRSCLNQSQSTEEGKNELIMRRHPQLQRCGALCVSRSLSAPCRRPRGRTWRSRERINSSDGKLYKTVLRRAEHHCNYVSEEDVLKTSYWTL